MTRIALDMLQTPALILDRHRLQANCERMAARATDAGVRLRPHLKTAKSAEVAAVATAGQFGGITVSTLAELDYFFRAGFTDLTYAVGMAPAKMGDIERLRAEGARIQLLADSEQAVAGIAGRASKDGLPVLIEIDCGAGRAGVDPQGDALLALGRSIASQPSLSLAGVLTHAGHAYHAADADERRRIAVAERDAALLAARRLREDGHACETVSIGSTPTALTDIPLDGVTEIRPGVYVFFDLAQAGLGVCALEEIAVSVLATVIGHHRALGHLLIDAGALALSKDVSANEFRPHTDYGLVCDAGGAPVPGLHVADVHQEHGFVRSAAGPLPFERFPIGSRVRILPNHACMTVAPYREYYALDPRSGELARWSKTCGW